MPVRTVRAVQPIEKAPLLGRRRRPQGVRGWGVARPQRRGLRDLAEGEGELPQQLGGARARRRSDPGACRLATRAHRAGRLSRLSGARVATVNAAGTYAEFAVVPVARLVRILEGVTAKQGAAAMLQGMTAHYLTTSTYPVKPGDVCLVHAAAGGVGLLLCQLAKRRGARVIGTVSTPEKAALAKAAGADRAVLYTSEDFVAAAKEFTGGRGVNVIFDSVGKTTFEKGFDALALRGMMALLRTGERAGGSFRPTAPEPEGLDLPDPADPLPLHRHARGAAREGGGRSRLGEGRLAQAPRRRRASRSRGPPTPTARWKRGRRRGRCC